MEWNGNGILNATWNVCKLYKNRRKSQTNTMAEQQLSASTIQYERTLRFIGIMNYCLNVELNEVAASLLIRLKMRHMTRTLKSAQAYVFDMMRCDWMSLSLFQVRIFNTTTYTLYISDTIRLHNRLNTRYKAQFMRHTKTKNCYIFWCRVIVQVDKKKAAKLLIHSWAAAKACANT